MGTRSTIAIQEKDLSIRAIYCHWDGYPDGVGATLANLYNTKKQAEELINLGGFSALHDTLEETKAGAYGSEHDKPRTFMNVQDWLKNFNSGEEYFYLYREGIGWKYSEGESFFSLKTAEKVS
jgi:hypothetical protein